MAATFTSPHHAHYQNMTFSSYVSSIQSAKYLELVELIGCYVFDILVVNGYQMRCSKVNEAATPKVA